MVNFIATLFSLMLLFTLTYFAFVIVFEAGLAIYRRLPRRSRNEIDRALHGSYVQML